MGLFDRLKASVGIGGAKLELAGPAVLLAGSRVPVELTLHGGNVDQTLSGLELALEGQQEVEEQAPNGGTTRRVVTTEAAKQRVETAGGKSIPKGSTQRWELALELPSFEALQGPDHPLRMLSEGGDDEHPFCLSRPLDEPLPTLDELGRRRFELRAAADIPGAVDPAARQRVTLLPEAKGPLRATGRLGHDGLVQAVTSAGAAWVLPVFAGEQWFLWYANAEGKVVGLADLQAVVSIRPEGLVRAHTNPDIPGPSVLPKLASEREDRRSGGLVEARSWALELVTLAEADVVLLRPIGNAVFALKNLRLAS